MLGRTVPWLVAAAALCACNPPILLEAETGWQPRSERYVVRHLEEPQRAEPMPDRWGLIERREMLPSLRAATSATTYDMVFFERMANGGYDGGSALYVWVDERAANDGSPRSIAASLVEQFGKAPLVKLLPAAPDRGCPCSARVSRETPINTSSLQGVEQIGTHKVGGEDGDTYGYYLAVVRNPKAGPEDRTHVVVLFVAPSARFPGLLNDASALVRRIRWE